ncbi:biliverdin-producing heme oxygenase [Celerinatantimonas yamalensis]|uniref:Biliverdin-producing heme oxygenase n=1 Tax=Celerinatantimonas yamalensis TaxID=559956 RepID=A0ABW9G631_9GAMM
MDKQLLSEQLKTRTWHLHNQLDHQPILKCLIAKDIDVVAYQKAMRCFHNCFVRWQLDFEQAATLFLPPEFARIDCQINSLKQDVAYSPNASPEEALRPSALKLQRLEDYLGYSYVMHGSHMGGKMIYKRLSQASALQGLPLAYFSALAHSRPAIEGWDVWKHQFDQYVEEHTLDPSAIIDAAIDCFTQLVAWFADEHQFEPIS